MQQKHIGTYQIELDINRIIRSIKIQNMQIRGFIKS